jgi:hypothetical protein
MTKIEGHNGFFMFIVERKEGRHKRLAADPACEESVYISRELTEEFACGWS